MLQMYANIPYDSIIVKQQIEEGTYMTYTTWLQAAGCECHYSYVTYAAYIYSFMSALPQLYSA